MTMLTKIDNSLGIKIPQKIVEQVNLKDCEIEFKVTKDGYEVFDATYNCNYFSLHCPIEVIMKKIPEIMAQLFDARTKNPLSNCVVWLYDLSSLSNKITLRCSEYGYIQFRKMPYR